MGRATSDLGSGTKKSLANPIARLFNPEPYMKKLTLYETAPPLICSI